MKFKLLLTIILISNLFILSQVLAINPKSDYPRIANYFLKWEISDKEAIELAKWDLLILDMELQVNSPDKLIKIRKLNPDIIILAYITSQEIIYDIDRYFDASLRQKLFRNISSNWWLKDINGEKISYWPGTFMLNVSNGAGLNSRGERFNDYLPRFVNEEIKSSYLWDGVFYDNTWGDVNWVTDVKVDINNNRQNYNSTEIDKYWSKGVIKILEKTREMTGDEFIIVGNGRVHAPYLPHLHGMMLEGFPSYWESGGTWAGSVSTYLKMPEKTRQPSLPIINTYNKDRENYKVFRFGLVSALLGDGYYSFDYDVTCHSQTWWYDEYEVSLGTAISAPYNLLDLNNLDIKPGLWRRDFTNGSVILNSTDKKERIVFKNEIFEKIKGSQDKTINNGQKINWLEINSQDAIVLLKEVNLVLDTPFINGQFVRIFDKYGSQARAGFFSYLNNFTGNSQVLLYDLFKDGNREVIFAHQGKVSVFKNNSEILSFHPFHQGFKGDISLAVADLNNNGQLEIITGAGIGGGPQVRVFSNQGHLVSTFFAFDPKFRGGIDIAAADTNGNGKAEIITGAGIGGGPQVRIFDYSGRELSNFFVYENDFRGGISVSAGDLNGNNKAEIIVGPKSNREAEIKYFNSRGELINSFIAIDNYYQGVNVSSFDISGNNINEIIIGLKDF